jgi:uncharacterized damage-inducible protein DinB
MTHTEEIRDTIADLLAYHRWANGKLLGLCRPLTDEHLDREEPIGPGSLRKTLFHVWAAESLWLSRWKGNSPTSFPIEEGVPIDELHARFEMLHAARNGFLAEENPKDYSRIVSYRNLAGEAFANPLVNLIMHVVNHAVHHRAQAIHFLKLSGVKIPGGLDYIFYRIAVPTVAMSDAMREILRGFGLEVGDSLSPAVAHSPDLLRLYFDYGDWGMTRLFDEASKLSDADLDRDFGMGLGTLRKTLLHLYDAESWWRGNWRGEKTVFPKLPAETSIADLRERWAMLADDRKSALASRDSESLMEPAEADFGAGPMVFRTGESMLQLGVHGTHHRAQAINMLRRLGVATKPTDFVVFVRETGE